MSALANTEVNASGMMIQSTARMERKVIRHMKITTAYTVSSIFIWDFSITTLVAASIPALPAASLNSSVSVLYSAANSSTAAVTRDRVSALWSSR